MMSSQSVQRLMDPVAQSKMSGFLSKQALQYSGAYFTYDPRGKDGAGFTPNWSHSKPSLLDGRSPVSQLPAMEGQNHMICKPDNKTSTEEGHAHSPSVRHTPGPQGFTYYTRSPDINSPTDTTPARKQAARGVTPSSPSENSVYLAIPKPIYGHSPCCNELGCMLGPRYSVEHGPQRMPNTAYECEWMHMDPHYSQRSPIQRKAQETLMQHGGLQFEPNAERLPLKDMSVDTYHSLSPSRARALPTFMEPSYSSYPSTQTHALFSPLSEQRQRLQTSPQGYHTLYHSHPRTYERMTSEVYQDRSPMSKYGQLPQHPMFYYPQANVEVESRTVYKDTRGKHREDVFPIVPKHTISNPRERYLVSPPIHGEIPMSGAKTLPSHSFIQGFDYPCYAVPRMNLNASQLRASPKRQHVPLSLHSNGVTTSPSGPHMNGPLASSANLHKDQPSASLHVDQSRASPAYLHMDEASVTPGSIQMNRVLSPLISLHTSRPSPSPTNVHMDRPLDYSHYKGQVTPLKHLQGLLDSPGAWISQPPAYNGDQIHKAVNYSAHRKIICSPAVATRKEHHASESGSDTPVCNESRKRRISHSPTGHTSPSIKIKEENRYLCEIDLCRKRKRIEVGNVPVEADYKPESPPMPIIDIVFSLAPYKAFMEASGVLRPAKASQTQSPGPPQPQPCIQEEGPKRDGQQPVVCPVPTDNIQICHDTRTEKPAVDIIHPKDIKLEKLDPQDADDHVSLCKVNPDDCSETTVKKEVEEIDSPDTELILVIKKCEPDAFEAEPLVAVKDETSDDATTCMTAGSSTQGLTHQPCEQMVVPHTKSSTPPHPPDRRLNFLNIPNHCLRLTNLKIVLPDSLCRSPVQTPEKPPVLQTAEVQPRPELQKPVRKHFFELHHSLCKLVSTFVSVSPEEELRTWLSQMDLTKPAPPTAKIQKVSSLLGVNAREVWLSEERKSAFQKVLERLVEYIVQERCPFPHVIRAGAVFIPMLVVKELLFPQVLGGFIDQVLQEHKVELRPTTLSEEKILTQLHRRPCSSRLRRLLSLKHLPNIYADVVNLFYHACVCKRLGLEMDDDSAQRDPHEDCEETDGSTILHHASPLSGSDRQKQKDQQRESRFRNKSRVKSSSRRMFLEDTLSEEEEVAQRTKVVKGLKNKDRVGRRLKGIANGGSDDTEHSWTCPLTSDELSSCPSDTERAGASIPHYVSQSSAKSQGRSRNCSGMVLKLRRVLFSKGLNWRKARYQAVSSSGTTSDPSVSKAEDGERDETTERSSEKDRHRRTASKGHRWQRAGGLRHGLRPLAASSKRLHRSLMKIKYCPYLSACHSAEHRRRCVLRSAVRRARHAMKVYYPDLVGKRIRHLYEEDDKSEVWYGGEVVRIHEANPNPMKTVFEVRYDSEPEWKYYLELLMDYKKGWLKLEE